MLLKNILFVYNISTEYDYAITPYTECPRDTVVSSQGECSIAGTKLGYSFMKTISNPNRPAGCYWYRGYFKNSFYNTYLNASAAEFPTTGGVCKYSGSI